MNISHFFGVRYDGTKARGKNTFGSTSEVLGTARLAASTRNEIAQGMGCSGACQGGDAFADRQRVPAGHQGRGTRADGRRLAAVCKVRSRRGTPEAWLSTSQGRCTRAPPLIEGLWLAALI